MGKFLQEALPLGRQVRCTVQQQSEEADTNEELSLQNHALHATLDSRWARPGKSCHTCYSRWAGAIPEEADMEAQSCWLTRSTMLLCALHEH